MEDLTPILFIINRHLSAKNITKAAGVERSQRLLPLIINFQEFWNQPLKLSGRVSEKMVSLGNPYLNW